MVSEESFVNYHKFNPFGVQYALNPVRKYWCSSQKT
jgi:hypothetical protein